MTGVEPKVCGRATGTERKAVADTVENTRAETHFSVGTQVPENLPFHGGQLEEPESQREVLKASLEADPLRSTSAWSKTLTVPICAYFIHASNKYAELTFRSTHRGGYPKIRREGKGCHSHIICRG